MLFIIVKYFGQWGIGEQSVKPAKLMGLPDTFQMYW